MYVSSSKFTTQFRPRRSPRHHTKVRKYSAQLHSVVLNKSHHTAIMAQAGLDSYVNRILQYFPLDTLFITLTTCVRYCIRCYCGWENNCGKGILLNYQLYFRCSVSLGHTERMRPNSKLDIRKQP